MKVWTPTFLQKMALGAISGQAYDCILKKFFDEEITAASIYGAGLAGLFLTAILLMMNAMVQELTDKGHK